MPCGICWIRVCVAVSRRKLQGRDPSAVPQGMLCKRIFLGAPGSSPAPAATLERGGPRGTHKNSCGDTLEEDLYVASFPSYHLDALLYDSSRTAVYRARRASD